MTLAHIESGVQLRRRRFPWCRPGMPQGAALGVVAVLIHSDDPLEHTMHSHEAI